MRTPSRDGVEIAVHELGGDGPPLLVAHATGFLAAVYRPLAEHLAERFTVWALDFRSHGDSGKASDLSWVRMAEDVAAAVEVVGGQPYAVGHSMGGAALVLAELDRPGTFSGLYLYEPVIFPPGSLPGGENPLAAGARRRRPSFPSREAAYENYSSKPPLDVLAPAALRAYVDEGFVEGEDGSAFLKCRPDDEADTFLGGGAHDAWARLGALGLPVTIAQGGVPDPGPGPLAPEQARRIPSARHVVLEGLGHFGPVQDPAAVAATILESAESASLS